MAQQLNAQTVTAADVEAGLTVDWCYSDAYKEIHGFRPRGHSAAQEASFWNTFEEEFERVAEEEAQQLASLGEHYGRIFPSYSAYYNFLDEQSEAEYRAEKAAREAAAAERAEFNRRGSPMPLVDAWEHGDLIAA